MKTKKSRTRRFIGVVFVAGLLLSVLASERTWRMEQRDRREEFLKRAESHAALLASVFPEMAFPLSSVQAFFNASGFVTRDEFNTFSRTYLEQNAGVAYLAWIPAVAPSLQALHEARGRADGLERYQLRPLPGPADQDPRLNDSPSFPIFYVEPFLGHKNLAGLDLATDKRIQDALWFACDHNHTTVRIHPDWIQPGLYSNCTAMAAPVYAKTGYPFTASDRRKSLEGFVLAVMEMPTLIERAIANMPTMHIDSIMSIRQEGGDEAVFVRYARSRAPEDRRRDRLSTDPAYRHAATFPFQDLHVRIACTPAPGFFAENPLWTGWATLAGGFLLTVLMCLGLYWADRRERRINELVDERTAALQESEKRFMDVLYASQDAILLISDGTFIDCNEATARMLGYATREEFLMSHPSALSPPTQPDGQSSFEKANEMIKIALETGFHRFEWVHRKAGGEDFPVEVSLTSIVMHQKNIIHCLWRDLTEKKSALDKMSRIYSAVEDYSDGVLLADEQARVLYINMALGMRFQQTIEDLQKNGLRTLFADKEQADVILQALLGGASWSSEVNLLTAQGEHVPALLRGSPTMDAQFAVVGFSFTITDLTERKQMESQLLQSQKMQSVGQLAAGIAHEINTPIQFVGDNLQFLDTGFTDLKKLLSEYAALRAAKAESSTGPELLDRLTQAEAQADLPYLEEEIPKAIAQSKDGIRRVAEIVKAMKDFSHPGMEEMTPVDVNKAIETTATMARNEWKYIAEMKMNLAPDLPSVICLPGEFNQVLLNLMINAAHAIADALKGQEGQKGLIRITTRRVEQGVEIRVADNGSGIPESARTRIFEPFFTTKDVGRGTGQGLAIAYNVIVKKHKGAIRFETGIGKGTTFMVTLPLEGALT